MTVSSTDNKSKNDKDLEQHLIQHFKDIIKDFNNSHKTTNICTDFPTMHDFLNSKYNTTILNSKNNLSNLHYHALTHRIVPGLEKKGILKRYKMFDGTYVFMINKENLGRHRTL